MAIALRGSGDIFESTSSVTCDFDLTADSVQENDLLLAFVSLDSASTGHWSNETGWNTYRAAVPGNAFAMYWRLAPASFTTVSFDHSESANDVAGVCVALSGVDTTTPIVSAFHSGEAPTASTFTSPPCYGFDGSWVVVGLTLDDSDLTNGTYAPTGYTALGVSGTTAGAQALMARKALSGTAPITETPGAWASLAAAEQGVAWSVVVLPTGGWSAGGSSNLIRGKL